MDRIIDWLSLNLYFCANVAGVYMLYYRVDTEAQMECWSRTWCTIPVVGNIGLNILTRAICNVCVTDLLFFSQGICSWSANKSVTKCISMGIVYYVQIVFLSMKETWEHVSMHWQQGDFELWVNCFMCWMPAANPLPQDLTDSTTTQLLCWVC